MKDFKIDDALINKISSFDWALGVDVMRYNTVKGDALEWISVDVDCGYIETLDDYQEIVCSILDDVREITHLDKVFDGITLKLKATEKLNKNNDIEFEFHVLKDEKGEKQLFGDIMGCKLVKVKHTFTTLTCEMKGKK